MKRILSLVLLVCVFLSSCSVFDKDYGKSMPQEQYDGVDIAVKIPEIKSADEVMPTYFDISPYDEENYADIYLGKDFKYKATYSGSVLELPASYKKMIKSGWVLPEDSAMNDESKIMAGKSAQLSFKNEYGKYIIAVFYNKSNSSKSLSSCPIVKYIIEDNMIYSTDSIYGQFFINGISNDSAITDVIECLGAPSHFYRIDDNNYYLDYFLTENDKRSKITVYINIPGDCVTRLEFSLY